MSHPELTISVPTLFFSALSIMVLAYTSKFVAYGNIIRKLYQEYKSKPDEDLINQIKNLRERLSLIRNMQVCGITGLLLCVVSMFNIYIDNNQIATYVFGVALILFICALLFIIKEILISTKALDLKLKNLTLNNSLDSQSF